MNASNHTPLPFPQGTNNENEANPYTDIALEVQQLTEMVANAVKGIQTAREDIEDDLIRNLLDDVHHVHDRHYTELAEMLIRYQQEPKESGTVAGQLHRVWMDLKALVTDGDPEAILESVKFGEQQLEAAYADALKSIQFPSALQDDQTMLAQQRNDILEVIDKIAAMRKEAAS